MSPPEVGAAAPPVGERRWPMALAVVAVGVLHACLPADFRAAPGWIFQLVLLVFLAVLLIGDPGRIDQDRRWLRITTDALIALITVTNCWAAVRLVQGIVVDSRFSDAEQLLLIGAIVWVTNILAFALWYWDLDRGGPAARARGGTQEPAFIFPEMDLAGHQDRGWTPQFVDYLSLSFNTATAFSPTDVSSVRSWAKLLTMAEAAVSMLVALLVIARAVNILH